jgi:hypothetical protein
MGDGQRRNGFGSGRTDLETEKQMGRESIEKTLF